MISKTFTTSSSVKNTRISVEVDLNNHGLPSFEIVGLADKTVEESKSRVRASIVNSGYSFPIHHLTVNLTPAELKKEGAFFDLPIAIGILVSSGQISMNNFADWLFFGEVSLDGGLTISRRIIAELLTAQDLGLQKVFVPLICKDTLEKSFLNLDVVYVNSITQTCRILSGLETPEIHSLKPSVAVPTTQSSDLDFMHIKGQSVAKRALEIAATGRHNVLFYGPPGTGKTMLAKTFPTILPNLSEKEAESVYRIYVDADLEEKRDNYFNVPFRNPHHSASPVGIIGGGPKIKPGELSLSHKGVLFLDEMAEFPRSVLESIRQPLEDHEILISRSGNKLTYPADFILIGSTNPCPCGYYRNPLKTCTCSYSQLDKYRKKLSGPILDRIDLFVNVNDLPPSLLLSPHKEESSAEIKKRVIKAQKFLHSRNPEQKFPNSRLQNKDLIKNINFEPADVDFFTNTIDKLSLSPRSVTKILKVSRSIADLDASLMVNKNHFAEALAYKLNLPSLS